MTGKNIRSERGRLFIIADGTVRYIEDSNELVAYAASCGLQFDFTRSDGAITKAEFFTYARHAAPRFEMISRWPHYPKVSGYFYINDVEPEENGKLDELLDFFLPASSADKDLLETAFITTFWGGPWGKRPAFLIDGLDNDVDLNRGIGKSTVADVASDLSGGYIDLNTKADGDGLKKLLLGCRGERIARMDNVKSTISHATIESLITSKTISGHRMYFGHDSIDNWFTYFITFNDASLSKDMAQRAVVIRLKRPLERGDWDSRIATFIEKNRTAIIANIGARIARRSSIEKTETRFAEWELGVLGKVSSDPKLIYEKIKEEQGHTDEDVLLAKEILDLITDKFSAFYRSEHMGTGHVFLDPDKDVIAVNRSVVFGWLHELFAKGTSRKHVIKMFARCRPKKFLLEAHKYTGAHYLIWAGDPELRELASCWRLDIAGKSITVEPWKFHHVLKNDAPSVGGESDGSL